MRRLLKLLLTVATASLGLVFVEARAAVAQPAWAIQATPNPVVPTGSLLGVSCTTGTACTGVGYSSSSSGTTLPLAESWNGSSWTVQSTPNPAGAEYNFLAGVSCTSATACMAVGYYGNSAGTELPLAESWNGTSWTIQSAPPPSGATFSALLGVSCTSPTACTAVGNYGSKNGTQLTLAEAWNGTSWSVQSTPTPSGATVSSLAGLSCASATACAAVGNYFNKSGAEFTLAEAWNGSSWSVQTTPNPSGSQFPQLAGVSCKLATACTAVGDYFNSSGTDVTLAEAWNGTSWSIQSTPNPSGATVSSLSGVSCSSATACTAVGSYFNGANTQSSLVEAWNGSSWSIQPSQNGAGATASSLIGVVVGFVNGGGGLAVGYSTNAGGTRTALTEAYYGIYGWVDVSTPSPNGAAGSVLSNVSCISATSCTGVGYSINTSGANAALAEAWNGSAWSIEPTPIPSGAKASSLSGVSCTAPTACTAVGNYVNSAGTTATLAEAWNGSGWSIESTPNPIGAVFSAFNGVSCTSATACTAVGTAVTTIKGSLAESWNGTSWSVQPIHDPSGAKASALTSVVVGFSNGGGGLAVGQYTNSSGVKVPLSEAYYGPLYGWIAVSTPNPTGATSAILSGISCASGTACSTVGSYTTSSATSTLAEFWNGSGWVLQSTPNPGATLSALSGVSCTSSTACTSVGYYGNTSGITVTLAEAWNGTSWSTQATPNPAIASASVLYDVSCSSATACTAVGRYDNGVHLTLAEAD